LRLLYKDGLSGAAPSGKQKFGAIRIRTGGVLPTNPGATVCGPRHVVKVCRISGDRPRITALEASEIETAGTPTELIELSETKVLIESCRQSSH
jgi:hypothetical protein